jgi:hypothetical protein
VKYWVWGSGAAPSDLAKHEHIISAAPLDQP